MFKGNYHLHTTYSDGKCSLEDHLKTALTHNFKAIGFSDHSPTPYNLPWSFKQNSLESYLTEIDLLQQQYLNKIEIYKGLEVDFFDYYKPYNTLKEKLNLDYLIGSVHILEKMENLIIAVDGREETFVEGVKKTFDNDFKKAVLHYYDLELNMIETLQPDIIGHLDLIKFNNKNYKYFDEESYWYLKKVEEVLKLIKEKDLVLELNTGGKARGYILDFYPSIPILKIAKDLNLKITINSDAHHNKYFNAFFNEAYILLKELGFKYIFELKNGLWQQVTLN